jgi:hypothetical protein
MAPQPKRPDIRYVPLRLSSLARRSKLQLIAPFWAPRVDNGTLYCDTLRTAFDQRADLLHIVIFYVRATLRSKDF